MCSRDVDEDGGSVNLTNRVEGSVAEIESSCCHYWSIEVLCANESCKG